MNIHGQQDPGRFLSVAEVCERVGLSRSTLYELERAGRFPPRVRISRLTRWAEAEVIAWQREALAARAMHTTGEALEEGEATL